MDGGAGLCWVQRAFCLMSVLSNNQPEGDESEEAPGGNVVKKVRLITHSPVA